MWPASHLDYGGDAVALDASDDAAELVASRLRDDRLVRPAAEPSRSTFPEECA